jgi:hypothetical protein
MIHPSATPDAHHMTTAQGPFCAVVSACIHRPKRFFIPENLGRIKKKSTFAGKER